MHKSLCTYKYPYRLKGFGSSKHNFLSLNTTTLLTGGAVLMQRHHNPFNLGKLSFYTYGEGANTLYKQFFFAYICSPSNTIMSYNMIDVLNGDRDD